ncbi:MAG TPA: ParA family protein [Bryobacteraceae bacterium]|jgi:cellulose biosynthesis protein BcsQ
MTAPIIAFFNNKGGVGKTSLVYHLAWMFSDLGVRVLTADLDPQANLTAAFLDEETVESLWNARGTIFWGVDPLIKRTGGPKLVGTWELSPTLHLIVGDLRLGEFEDLLATGWGECRGGQPGGFVVTTAFWWILTVAARQTGAEIVLLDLGPNIGAINRSALIAADYLVVPLAPDLFSLQGMKNLGPTVTRWKDEWRKTVEFSQAPSDIPAGKIEPIGYVVQQHSVRLDRPVRAYEKWIERIPEEFRRSVLGATLIPSDLKSIGEDSWCLALLKHYHSLMPMAQEARKPMFHLKVADGAIGAHFQAVQEARRQFQQLAVKIAERTGVPLAQLSA